MDINNSKDELKITATVWQVIVLLVLVVVTVFVVIAFVYPYKYIKTEAGVIAINKYTRDAILYDITDISYAYKVKPKIYEGRDER